MNNNLRVTRLEYRKDKRPFHPSPTVDDCCCIARQLCNTSPNPAAIGPGSLKPRPLLGSYRPPPAIGHAEFYRSGASAASWMQTVMMKFEIYRDVADKTMHESS